MHDFSSQQIAANHAKLWREVYGNGQPGIIGELRILSSQVSKNSEHRRKWERRELVFMGAIVMLTALLGVAAVWGGQRLGEVLDVLAELRKAVQ